MHAPIKSQSISLSSNTQRLSSYLVSLKNMSHICRVIRANLGLGVQSTLASYPATASLQAPGPANKTAVGAEAWNVTLDWIAECRPAS
jgi:hypothetical protein